MALTEAGATVTDTVQAALVECASEPEPVCVTATPVIGDSITPTEQAAEATIEQTGADPPPG